MPYSTDNSDDSTTAVLRDYLPDWILTWPERVCKSFIDDDYLFAGWGITFGEIATGE